MNWINILKVFTMTLFCIIWLFKFLDNKKKHWNYEKFYFFHIFSIIKSIKKSRSICIDRSTDFNIVSLNTDRYSLTKLPKIGDKVNINQLFSIESMTNSHMNCLFMNPFVDNVIWKLNFTSIVVRILNLRITGFLIKSDIPLNE